VTSHPLISDLSIAEATDYLSRKPRKLEEFLNSLEEDPRAGMKNLAQRSRSARKAQRAEAARLQRLLKHERKLWKKGVLNIAGVDEVGRGPLAGPVVAAAVILPEKARFPGLDDSKALKPEERERLYADITDQAVSISVGAVEAAEIDRINIYQATLQAMRAAISGLAVSPGHVLVDGNRVPESGYRELAIVGGDAASQSIAAASVIAKVTRDREMADWDEHYPTYGFASHKGYASEAHTRALMANGPCPIHRRSFCTVEDALAAWSPEFREVRETVEKIKRLSELEVFRKQILRRSPQLRSDEVHEIESRIERRAIQLQQPGIAGEEAAENWLVQAGFSIIERNMRMARGEIDLIAQRGDTLAFVEVKSSADRTAEPQERVTTQKQSRIRSAATAYLSQNPTSLAPRFDVVSVRLDGNTPKVEHYPSAFGQ
jgi:ribonuclease HII